MELQHPRVTVAIPVYKRLDLLPRALASVAAQTYPAIDLLVSDNGQNGDALRSLIAAHFPHPFRLRRNPVTVPIAEHFNQLLASAAGEYFVLLCDDDEISADFVAELVALLESDRHANVALARPETIDTTGQVRTYEGAWPPVMEGVAFLEAWATKRVRLVSTVTLMARTAVARERGGYIDLPRALYSDNVLLLRLALGGHVLLAPHARFRWRVDDASTGFSASHREVAAACRGFFRFLDKDAQMRALYAKQPAAGYELRRLLRLQCATWFFFRWKERYSRRLSTAAWIRAAFSLPFIPEYYKMVFHEIAEQVRTGAGHM